MTENDTMKNSQVKTAKALGRAAFDDGKGSLPRVHVLGMDRINAGDNLG